jgi:hypothetical protein
LVPDLSRRFGNEFEVWGETSPEAALVTTRRGRLLQRLVGILVAAEAFERIAACNDRPAQITGLAGNAAHLVEAVEMWFEFVIGAPPILAFFTRNPGAVLVRTSHPGFCTAR